MAMAIDIGIAGHNALYTCGQLDYADFFTDVCNREFAR